MLRFILHCLQAQENIHEEGSNSLQWQNPISNKHFIGTIAENLLTCQRKYNMLNVGHMCSL